MRKLDVLDAIKNNDYLRFNNFIEQKGDINLMIYGRSLLYHAVKHQADNIVNVLLLYGANVEDMMKEINWAEKLDEMSSDFIAMVKEIQCQTSSSSSSVAQTILKVLGHKKFYPYPFSYRNVLSHKVRKYAYMSKLMVGIHLFEYRDWDFLKVTLFTAFQCQASPEKNKKFAMIVTASALSEYDVELPGLSARIRGFVEFLEISVQNLDYQLGEMKKKDSFIIGIHYSDEPSLRDYDNTLDLDSKFFDSMKTAYSLETRPPVIVAAKYTLNSLIHWDDQLNDWVEKFKRSKGYYPNILLASSATYSRIDMVINARGKDRVKGKDGKIAAKDEFISPCGFKGESYELMFCTEEQLGIDTVKLIYDSDPDGGVPIPEDDLGMAVRKIS
jgi:hypothetical protein